LQFFPETKCFNKLLRLMLLQLLLWLLVHERAVDS